jgi:hypothetical protein
MNTPAPQTLGILAKLQEVFPMVDMAWAEREVQAGRIYLRGEVLCLDHASTCIMDPPDPQAAKAYILEKRKSWKDDHYRLDQGLA